MPAEELYRRTRRLSILWMGAFYGLIAQNVSGVTSVLDRSVAICRF
jgi:hypothetical protein